MKKVITSALLASALVTSAIAADEMKPYVGAAIGFGSIADVSDTYSGRMPLTLNVGFAAKHGYGIEGEFSTDLSAGTQTTGGIEYGVAATSFGGYLTYGYFVPSAKVAVKARLGYLSGSYQLTVDGTDFGNSISMGGLAYGVQVSYEVMAQLDVYVDYTEKGFVTETNVVFGASDFNVGARYSF